jgi:hypothetical protein
MLPYAHGVFVGADTWIRPQSKNQPKRIHNPLTNSHAAALKIGYTGVMKTPSFFRLTEFIL